MSILSKLTEKPWLSPGIDHVPEVADGAARYDQAATLGLRLYVAIIGVVFSIILVTYFIRMGSFGAAEMPEDLPWWNLSALCGIPPARDWKPIPEPWLMWGNTGVLVLSSFAWQWARVDIRDGRIDLVRSGLMAAGLLGLIFVIGQVLVWHLLHGEGYGLTAGPAGAFFYLITALHGAHILGGLFVWGRTTARVLQGAEAERVRLAIDLSAVYWHVLLIVWLVMFALLLIT